MMLLQDIGFSGSDIPMNLLLLHLWGQGAGSGYVHTWYDQSGNSNNATPDNKCKSTENSLKWNFWKLKIQSPIINFGTQSDPWFLQLPSGYFIIYQDLPI